MNPSSKVVLVASIILIALAVFLFISGKTVGGVAAALLGVLSLVGHLNAGKK